MRLQQKEFFERLMRDKPLSATRLVVPFPIIVPDDFIIGNEMGDPVRFFSDIHGSTLCVHFPVRVNATVQSRGMEYVVTDVRAMRFCDAMKEEKAAEKLGLADKVVDGDRWRTVEKATADAVLKTLDRTIAAFQYVFVVDMERRYPERMYDGH